MNIEQLVVDLTKQGVKLWVEGEQLRANAPKGVLTLETRDLLAKNKAELILLLHEKNAAHDTDFPLIKDDRPENLPLSFAQERLWLLDQLEPDNPFYNEQAAIKLHGQLNIVALRQSLNKIIARHEILRTNFRTINEQPVQVIADSLTLSVPVVDLTKLSETERKIACQQLVTAEATQPFDLAHSPLIRVAVVKLKEVEHVLLLTIHHIVYDGWSMGVLMRELASIYSALCNNLSPELPELPIQYADFAIWQRKYLQAEVLQTQLDYWKQELKDAPTLLELPTDRPRPAIQSFRGAVHHIEFSLELSQAIANFSRQQGTTLFMTLFAAYATLLYRYTGFDDIVVGTPIAGRDRLELEGLIGFFINTLVLRTNLSGNPSFQELLGRVRQVTLQAYDRADLPFEELVKALQPQRDLSHTPLCQVIFALENEPMSEIELSGLTVSPFETERTNSKFDLSLSMQNTSTGLIGVWQYNTDLFDPSSIERMSGYFQTLLEGIVANPEQRISQLPLLTEVEQQQLLVEWNNAQAGDIQDKCVHSLFEEQVARTPDAVAVEFVDTHSESQQLTYSQLNCRVNQLAHYLQSLGVEKEVLVGICLERSLDMLVGLLAIFKAGGAYVPLDPALPPERIALMLEDAQISVLLTQAELVAKLPKHQAQVVCLDTDWAVISHQPQTNPITKATSENLAYVIYTSGSTGKPKGVQICHKSVTNFLDSMRLCVGLSDKEIFLAITTISFDMAVLELYFPLIAGGQVVLATREIALDGKQLQKLVSKATIMHATPATWNLLLAAGWQGNRKLKILCGGEALPRKLALELANKGADAWNLYGPTETTVCLTAYKLEANKLINQTKETIPIGRLFAHNAQIYILDSHLQPVPVGVPGELHIGGVGVAKGYLNRTELTQEKFIPNPFGKGRGAGSREQGENSARAKRPATANSTQHGLNLSYPLTALLYKTGDLARYLPDGNIKYLGRIDNQVKVRGLRIELGEIEAVLSQHSHVESCCVIVREDNRGDKRLVAYVVAQQDGTQKISELRQFLKAKLPEYMVPNAFVMLESLPISPSGKVDRRALPAPDLLSTNADKYIAPRNPIEEMLASLWAQVLKVEQVGIYDNFFELGGHSLLATQLVSRIRNIFKVELPLRELFATATVAQLARSLEQLQQQKAELSAPPILPRPENSDLTLSYAQKRLWFLDQLQPNNALYNIPLALRLVRTLDRVALEQSLHKIIARHEALRTNFITIAGKSSPIIHPEMNWRMSVIDWQHLHTTEQEIATQQLAQQEAIQPFDLTSEPLVRVTLVVLSETEHVLSICMHHIVSDGWSTGVFVSELVSLYNAYSQGETPSLVPLPIQYADFAIWQQQWLQGDVLQTQLNYWQQQLKDAPTLLPLRTDRPRPAVQTFNGAHQEFVLSPQLTQKLTKLSQEQGCTLFMTLLSAYDTLLYRHSGQSDILVGSPIANRDRLELEGLIGFFVNTLVMRTNLADNPSFNELLSRVREMAMDAYAHQDLPFEMLVEALQPERNLSHTPLFQVMFVLQNAPMSGVELTGLTVTQLRTESVTAKFDLTLSMTNTPTGLVGWWEYSTDLFDASTIERMAGHFVTLLEGIVANPEEKISQLPLLTSGEQQQLLLEWNDTQANYLQHKCIHELFEEQVERTPDAVAVVYANEQLTYRQLNCRANSLAHYLKSLGVGADVLVGLCVERSLSMLVGLLGILKAGGAYLPLDPDYPTERLAYMLNDSQVSVLLTQEKLLANLPEHEARVVCLDKDWQDISSQSKDNLINSSTINNLAYVIYTSGSTGQPKGTLINHSNVVRLFAATDSWYQFNGDDVWTMFHSIAFDFSVWEIWGALLYGGRLVVVPYLVTRTPESFYNLLCQEKVTVLNQTPSAFRQLIQAEQGIPFPPASDLNLRLVIFGGEALEIKSLQPWFERHGDTKPQLVNMYGITETTVHVTYRPLSKADLNHSASVIGRPIPDLQVYVLDEYLQPMPIGVPGEMYVGGAGVARGYLNRSELTAQRFISHPFSDNPQARLYKTGDLARYLPNGELEYLGRIDNQVKIRGFRIELGEIEALLAQHPQVWESVVVVREDEPGDKRLVAYVVSKTEVTLTTAQLRHYLVSQLPSYMVPSAFVQLEALPLTANGKVDRRALPAPDSSRPELEDVFVAPSTPEEKILAAIWANVLGVEQVGINDNYFALGGDSIRSIQVLAQAKEQGLIFSVQQLFQHQTIHELVQELRTQDNDTGTSKLTQPFSLISEVDKQQVPSGIEDAYPLAMLQMGMIYHSEYNQDSAVYHDIFSLHLKTPLDVQLLQVAVQDLVNHHAVLRTSFELTKFSIPLQLVHQQVEVPLQVEDWCHLNDTEYEVALAAWFETQKKLHFDWTRPPLVRFFVHRRTHETFNLSLSFHHAIFDGWSLASMMSELFKRYLSLLGKGIDYVSLPLSITYRDFIALEQQALTSSQTQQYWSEKLQDSTFTKLYRWPSKSKNTDAQEIGLEEVTLSPEIFAGLKQLAQSAEVPLKSVLLAAHLRVLNFLSGEEDVVTGVVANGRPEQNDGERVLGLFLNTLPFRLQLAGGTWIDLVQKVFAAEREILPHRRYPLAEIQQRLGGEPLFETAFNFTHFHIYEQVLELDNLQLLGGKFFEKTNFPLVAQFSVSPNSSHIGLSLNYDPGELCSEQINRISDYYLRVLAEMANEPQARYELNSLISLEERHQLLVEGNQAALEYPKGKFIPQLFEEQVARTPNATAVIFEDRQLTYSELNAKANQLAHYLQTLGVKSGVLVGLCVERSLDMVVGMLGILKAGGAYVPLDPEYPQERLSFMLEDTQLQVLLTQQRSLDRLPQTEVQVVCLDTDWVCFGDLSVANPITEIQASYLAYVIYTSGSTGKPKGVMISHEAIANHCCIIQQAYKLEKSDRVLQFASINFDASLEQIFPTLIVGATLVLRGADVWTLTNFQKIISDLGLTVVNLPTAYWQQLAQEWAKTQILDANTQLRLVIVGGDVMLPSDVALWQQSPMSCVRLLNAYGPTEATITATLFEIPAHCNTDTNLQKIPIGFPLPNKRAYILDKHLQPVPVGVPGELHIGGVGLALGYLNRPQLTQEKFIPNPFGGSRGAGEQSFPSASSERLYKTGDLARYLPDGSIEYLGRIDNQVKIRGFRIELGEIESVLSQLSDLQAAVVTVREDNPGDKRLVAYVVPHPDSPPTINQLRQFLKAKLPEYMMPQAFVILESLPLTPSGKVDRRALPAPDLQSEITKKYAAPRTPVEELLTQIWAQVLKVELVGIHDNFFEIGGHSLLATQLVSRIRNIFIVELPLRELFTATTVAELAQVIGQLQQENLEVSAPPILKRAENADLPLSYAQQRLWFLDQLEPNSSFYNIPIGLRLLGTVQVAALEQSLSEIIQRHEALRTNFITVDGRPTQVIQTQTNWTLSVVDLKHLSTSEQEIATQRLAQQQAIQPFDLAKGALVRATLVVLSQTEHILLVCMHHIVSDGWSAGVFISELGTLYNTYSIGQSSPLAQLPIQYADFAIWQRKWLQGDVLQSQLSYWEQQLKDAPALLSLPTDRPRPARQTYNGTHQEFVLSGELTSKLAKLSQEQGCTLFMTLLAAFDTLLYRYTGTEDILVGTPIASRDRSEIEGLIGFFVNTLVMRTDLAGNPTFNELLSRVRDMAMQAYSHQHLPFEMLVEALQPERDLSYSPLFQVMFVLQNAPTSGLELSGLSVSPFSMKGKTSRFDLTLIVQNTDTGLVGLWEYNTDLFDVSTIERMTSHFVRLLEGITANPEQRISQLPLLTQVEQQQLLVEWNDTFVDYPLHKSIHQLFEEQVELTPDAVAVEFQNQQLTYNQLNYRANQLAHYLQSVGVKPDTLVGLCVERSLEMVIGLLGILKAGAAYVPIDSEYPSDRLSFILEDTQVKVLLTQQRLIDRLPLNQAKLVCLDTDAELISQCSQDNIISGVQPNNLVYIIYTSGSTGKPKGIAISQLALCNHILWHRDNLKISRDAKTLQFASVSFDVSFQEIFTTWCSGGTLFLITEELRRDALALLGFLQEKQIQRMFLPVVGLQQLAEFAISNELVNTHLREIITSGDQLRITPAIYEWLGKLTDCTLHNQYGPSESHLATSYTLPDSVQTWPLLPSIGRPISNTQTYILDKYLQPVPIGVTGEVYIAGVLLAQGYLNRPELTQEKFISNPFSSNPNSRLYKTGDLARYLPDGKLESLGRIDNQVKIRGFRIELGEVEAVLGQYDDIKSCCVIVREDTPGNKRLVAYVLPHQHCKPKIYELRNFLKAKLPDYMVPNAFVILEEMPLTPNGKVDRRALKAPSNINNLDTFVQPRNTIELQLTHIWSKILKLENLGVKDNFFDLGGHSLLVPYLIAQIKQQFSKDIPLVTVYQHPTIEELAEVLQKDAGVFSWSPLVALQPQGSNPPLFCLPGSGSHAFYLYNLSRCLGCDQPFYSFQANHLGREIAPVEDMASEYIQALQAVQPQGPYFLAGHSSGGRVAYEMAQQLLRQGQAIALVAILDTTAPNAQEPQMEWDDATWLIKIADTMKTMYAKDVDMYTDEFPLSDLDEQLKYVLEYLKMLEILPLDADTTSLKQLMHAFKVDVKAFFEYVPQQVHPVPLALLRASVSNIKEPVNESEPGIFHDVAWGWNTLSSEPVNVQFVPGNHITMMIPPHVQVLADRLRDCIEQAKKNI
ncbi:MAG: amino acid adenylation domain-containing protein [Nostoc sp.]|uniref:amino acid adenylation domain-containing protein n=1 Tax=Nostoc sp. TaxID=1180 RepID=UPI002FF63244